MYLLCLLEQRVIQGFRRVKHPMLISQYPNLFSDRLTEIALLLFNECTLKYSCKIVRLSWYALVRARLIKNAIPRIDANTPPASSKNYKAVYACLVIIFFE